jgi:hypothetical protein
MSTVFWLRAAACVTALLAVGHLLGSPWTPATNAEGQRLIDAMGSYHFDAMGFNRSYLDFYEGLQGRTGQPASPGGRVVRRVLSGSRHRGEISSLGTPRYVNGHRRLVVGCLRPQSTV